MIRLTLASMATHRRIWIGALLVAIVASAALSLAAGVVQTGVDMLALDPADLVRSSGLTELPPGFDQAQAAQLFFAAYASLGAGVVVVTSVAVVSVVNTVTNLTVELQRREYALWQLAGVSPRRITAVVQLQIALVSAVGGLVGGFSGFLFVGPVLDWALGSASGLPRIPVVYTAVDALCCVAVVVLLASFGARRSTRAAGRVLAIEALRGPSRSATRMTATRWVLAVAALAVAVLGIGSSGSVPLGDAGSNAMYGALAAVVVVVAVAPVLTPLVLRSWTALVPPRRSASWYLARNTVRYDLTRSTSTVTVMVIAIALPAVLTAVDTVTGSASAAGAGDAPASGGALGLQALVLLVGGAIATALGGATASVSMSSSVRDREHALIRSAGGTHGGVVLTALSEAVVLTGTALIEAVAVVLVVGAGLTTVLATGHPLVRPDFGIPVLSVMCLTAFVLVALATVVPTVLALRQRLVPLLAAD
ncbi:FtsX-like permease family protein [Microbacterium sp. M1A1_1b]